MRNNLFVPLLLVLISFGLFVGVAPGNQNADPMAGEEGFKINIQVKGLEDSTLLIAYYFGDKQYIKDTLLLDSQGKGVFEAGNDLGKGIYLGVAPNHNFFEFIINEPKFSLSTDTSNFVTNMKVKGSVENQIFYDFMKFIGDKRQEADKISADLKSLEAGSKKKEEMEARLKEIDKEVTNERNRIIASNPNTFVSNLFRAQEDPVIPENPNPSDSTFSFRYYKTHFWDNIDWSDGRLIRTPIIGNKLKTYLTRLTYEHPDSMIVAAKYLCPKSEANEEIFKFVVIYFINKAANSKVMCMDKLYLHMSETYYLKDKCPWADSTQLAKIGERAMKLRYNQCGNRAVNLKMPGRNGADVQVADIKSAFTILYFWDYDCGHCKKVTPALQEFYQEYKDKGVKIFAVCTREDLKKWNEGIEEKGIQEWMHGIDPEHKTNFRVFYDIYSTPVIYLLDKDKKIIAKRLDIEGLRQFIDHEMKQSPN